MIVEHVEYCRVEVGRQLELSTVDKTHGMVGSHQLRYYCFDAPLHLFALTILTRRYISMSVTFVALVTSLILSRSTTSLSNLYLSRSRCTQRRRYP
jgi:hypothetical protein